MTTNQVAYWNLQEQKRTNQVNEAIKNDTLGETVRHNKRTERQKDDENVIKAVDTGVKFATGVAKLLI